MVAQIKAGKVEEEAAAAVVNAAEAKVCSYGRI